MPTVVICILFSIFPPLLGRNPRAVSILSHHQVINAGPDDRRTKVHDSWPKNVFCWPLLNNTKRSMPMPWYKRGGWISSILFLCGDSALDKVFFIIAMLCHTSMAFNPFPVYPEISRQLKITTQCLAQEYSQFQKWSFAVLFIPRNEAIRYLFIVNNISKSYLLLDRKFLFTSWWIRIQKMCWKMQISDILCSFWWSIELWWRLRWNQFFRFFRLGKS